MGCFVSFYYGEVQWIDPCRLCWYQRMALFPLAWILGVCVYQNNLSYVFLSWPFVVFGELAALYQAVGMRYPVIAFCGQECSESVFRLFGFLTFPDLSALGFLVIGIFLYTIRR